MVPNHPNWLTFSRNLTNGDNSRSVITYINIMLMPLHFLLCKYIFNHRDVSCVSFFNCNFIYFLINVYLDLLQSALKYLKNTEVNIDNVLIMTGDFNIRNYSWDCNFHYHSIHKDILINIVNFFLLDLSKPTNCISTKYLDTQHESDLVIDFIFLRPNSSEYNNHSIYLEWHLTSDYILLTMNIAVPEENIQTKKHTIVKNRKEEDNFIIELIKAIKRLNTEDIQRKKVLENIIQSFTNCIERIWYKHLRIVNITKYSKK